LKKNNSQRGAAIFEFGEALAKEQVHQNPVTEPKRSQKLKKTACRFFSRPAIVF
jgi:hypothetical protein